MIAMTFTAFPLTANAVEVDASATAATEINVGSADDLTAACNTINTNGGEYIINLTADITNGQIEVKTSNAVVTVFGNGHKIDRSENGHPAVNVSNGATLNLGSPDGGEKNALTIVSGVDNDDAGIIYIWPDSTCHMYDKVTLKDHKGNNYLGGGVTVEGGTFIMNGGTIENCGIDGGSVCYGGGVGVFNGGYFEMNGGTIKDCYVISQGNSWQTPWVAGGGVFVLRASFTMNGGSIEGCTASNYEDSDIFDAFGGGVAVVTSDEAYYENRGYGYLDSNFTMNGGTIKNCSADVKGGALAVGAAYIRIGPMCTQSYSILPGSNKPGIFLNGGTMTGNDATDGGAIFLNWIRPSIPVSIKNMQITSNSAYQGAGIENYSYWTQAKIDGCTITGNSSDSYGGGIALFKNSSGGYTELKNSTVSGNTSGARGAGIYYDADSQLRISGTDVIQDNTYNGKLNNLNVLSLSKPVYVNGELTGSQIGLSDPTLWDDNKTDDDETAVSTNYLTSGFKTYNSEHPANFFTSDHETWSADFSNVNANEVRLTRGAVVDYYINNNDISEATYEGKDLFTKYVTELAHTVRVGDKIEAFYAIPQHDTNYIFKGWYYDRENDNDTRPVQFGKDKYLPNKNIYAHWIKVEDVEKDAEDQYLVPYESGKYGGFDLAGVQIRKEMLDHNFDMVTPGGMRFITTLSMDIVNQINAIKPNNIEYGYVAATDEGWIKYHKGYEKLQYVSKTANGINTLDPAEDKDFFGFAHNINCTSKQTNKNGVVRLDHQNYDKYLIYSLVINYEDQGDEKSKDVLARPYIHYTDANGLERVAYSDYRGTSTLGGCYTNYIAVENIAASTH